MDSQAPRKMQIARGLDTLRKRAALTQEEIAERAGVSIGTVSRYLNWRTSARLRVVTVRALATACGGTPIEVETLARLARPGASEGWWVGGGVPAWLNPLLSLEAEARTEAVFAPSAVPGLLQTRSYALALHQAQEVREAPGVIEQAVENRMRRQEMLERDDFHLWAVIDEAVLLRASDPLMMADQIDHLLDMASRPNVDIQVHPFSAGPHAAVNGQFLMLGFGSGLDDAPVVYVEMRGGGTYLDAPDEVTQYRIAWDYVRSQAADSRVSLDMLVAARERYRK
jgi:transcriptional regulator with XRE-family HTH domain